LADDRGERSRAADSTLRTDESFSIVVRVGLFSPRSSALMYVRSSPAAIASCSYLIARISRHDFSEVAN